MERASVPNDLQVPATSLESEMSPNTRFAPSRANARAIPAPMPLAAPVTTTVLPSKFSTNVLPTSADNAGLPQIVDSLRRETQQLAEDISVVAAIRWARLAYVGRCQRHLEWHPIDTDLFTQEMLIRFEIAALLDVLVSIDDVRGVLDASGLDAGSLQSFHHLRRSSSPRPLLDEALDRRDVVGWPDGLGQEDVLGDCAEHAPLRRCTNHDRAPGVFALAAEDVVDERARAGVAFACALRAVDEILELRLCQQRCRHLELREVDVLAQPRVLPPNERGRDCERRDGWARKVRVRVRRHHRVAIGVARQLIRASEGEQRVAVCNMAGIGTGLTHARAFAHDQPRVDLPKYVPTDAQSLERPGRVVVDEDIAFRDELREKFLTLWFLQVQRYRSLVPIEPRKSTAAIRRGVRV